MPQVSAGILLYRRTGSGTEVFLVHPGGPYWAAKDEGAWSVPKGLVDASEDELACARREFREETGFDVPASGAELSLGSFRLPSGKRLHELTSPGRYRALTALLLLGPQTPMLFQGQEFAASAPFRKPRRPVKFWWRCNPA